MGPANVARASLSLLLLLPLLAGCGGAKQGVSEYALGNYANARRYLTPLAAKGDPEAQYYLAQMEAHSLGGPRNPAMAERWYRASAEQGWVDSQYKLGLLYRDGQGVAKNEDAALAWLRKAADQGHPQAAFEWKALAEAIAARPKSEGFETVDAGCPYTRFYADSWQQGGTGDSLALSRRVLDTFVAGLEGFPFVRTEDVEAAYWRISVLVSRSDRDHGVVHGLVTMRAFADFEGKAVAYGYASRGDTLDYSRLFEHAIVDLDYFGRKAAEEFVAKLWPHTKHQCDDWRAGKLAELARLKAIREELEKEIQQIQAERAEREAAAARGEDPQGQEIEVRTIEPPEGLPPEMFE